MLQKCPPVKDKKFLDSFKEHGRWECLITGYVWTEYSSETVDGCHITWHRNGLAIKHDDRVIPLRHSLHLEMDKNQPAFWRKYWPELFGCEAPEDEYEIMEIVLGIAKQIHENFNAGVYSLTSARGAVSPNAAPHKET